MSIFKTISLLSLSLFGISYSSSLYSMGSPKNAFPTEPMEDESKLTYSNAALIDAIEQGNSQAVQLLLEAGADVNMQNSKRCKNSPLILATAKNLLDVAQILLLYKAEINQQNYLGETPLHVAARKGHIEILKMLLGNGADANIKDDSGCTPLHYATGHKGVVKALFQDTIKLDHTTDPYNEDGLNPAEAAKQYEMVKMLLNAQANANIQNNSGCTPLHYAAKNGHLEMVKALCKANARIDLLDKYGNTPAKLAKQSGQDYVANLLEKYASTLAPRKRIIAKKRFIKTMTSDENHLYSFFINPTSAHIAGNIMKYLKPEDVSNLRKVCKEISNAQTITDDIMAEQLMLTHIDPISYLEQKIRYLDTKPDIALMQCLNS